ncbi:MAG: hypothetical protein R2932_09805 [Caldilineaceae bacterium]
MPIAWCNYYGRAGRGELAAFRAYADLYPDDCLLLVDTVGHCQSGVPHAIKVFEELKRKAINRWASGSTRVTWHAEYSSRLALLNRPALRMFQLYCQAIWMNWSSGRLSRESAGRRHAIVLTPII